MRRWPTALLTAALTGGLVSACSSSPLTDNSTVATAQYPPALQLILRHPPAPTNDTIEVFVCEVPVLTNDPLYGDLPLRLHLDPTTIAAQMEGGVGAYFETLSHGLYHAHFVAGTTLAMTADETHDHCIDRALDASAPDAATVMVVATAEDLADAPGGYGRPGSACPTRPPCSAKATRRAIYVGGSDFYLDGNPAPLLDLIEHEIGHTLDLPHSGDSGGDKHASGLDVMSNSAAPRLVQPARIDAQDTIAINRVALGWMPASALAVVAPGGGSFELSPSTGASGLRLLVLPIDRNSFVTVEFLTADGFDDFLPAPGVAVHLIDQSPTACGRPATGAMCTGVDRRQIVEGSATPHLDLLDTVGPTRAVGQWTIGLRTRITATTTTAEVDVLPTHG